MPKLIVTSRYLKSGNRKNLLNYVKYIATREGAVVVSIKNPNASVSKSQQDLIKSLLNDFKDSKELLEYEDNIKNPTLKNASEFISAVIDRNMDLMSDRKNYVGYLANRPGAVKSGSHGLFSQENTSINLEQTAKEISEHKGNVWTHVVAVRRDNANRMGYDNLSAWRELVKRQIPKIAENQKINMRNLKWYAAFHDRDSNPHVHIIVYSTDEKEGFLTNHGIEKIRSGFANDIYQDELHHLYEQQTNLRNELKTESKNFMKSLAENISQGDFSDTELLNLIKKLSEQLNNTKGKKVYGYLKSEVKSTVDEIFSKLSENENIKSMYSKWCELEQNKHDVYSSARVKFPSLVDNKNFKSVKNMIIQQVINMNSIPNDIEILEIEPPEPNDEDSEDLHDFIEIEILNDNDESEYISLTDTEEYTPSPIDEKPTTETYYNLKWSKAYKSACGLMYKENANSSDIQKAEDILLSESKQKNVLAINDLGKLYFIDKFGKKDDEKSFEYYKEALQGFMEIEPNAKALIPFETKYPDPKPVDMRSYIWYRIGKFHCYGIGTKKIMRKHLNCFPNPLLREICTLSTVLEICIITVTELKRIWLKRFIGI